MKRILLALAPLVLAGAAFAETGFQFAVPNVNLPSDPNVRGMRLSLLYGGNESTRGVDFGVLSYSSTSRAAGVAFIGGVHHVKQSMSNGASFSVINYHEGTDSGLNWAFVNILNDAGKALDLGFITYAEGPTLVDIGGINISKSSTVQVGFLNMTEHLKSFQFGFLNVAENGFLPIFPIFNFPTKK